MKYFYIISLSLLCNCCIGQNPVVKNNPFLALKTDSVVIYDYNDTLGEIEGTPIVNKGKLSQKIWKSAKLENIITEKFNELLGDTASFGQAPAFCFEPHLGIVYWKAHKPIAYISICMGCNHLEPSLNLKAQEQCPMGSGKNTYYACRGMSKSFRIYINSLLIRYSFSHQIDLRSE